MRVALAPAGDPGATTATTVAGFPGVTIAGGLAVSSDGTWAYLTNLTDIELGRKVTPDRAGQRRRRR